VRGLGISGLIRHFHADCDGALTAIEFVLILIVIVFPLILLMRGLLQAALVEFEGLTMTLLASPFF
jgi:Flp pilus assembly pilin Flp